ncbi:amidohydrolase family protein [Luteolibacter ambystomatis]|uniref:Amidohydrolase family protein n=1 Tax=Luteolibacter ambystomatis TaxID=2824561 RepID=A0A975PGG6_9BACT|nr:amidohydrolase family protein [Luteolibacter ambystomatis]QUE52287.1 amidohydrolase family protein [Luteolibacter ambystomatis]
MKPSPKNNRLISSARSLTSALTGTVLMSTLSSCRQDSCIAPTPQTLKIAGELRGISATNSSLARSTPVVDVHVHTFNARYLPLRGIILGKRDAAAPWTWLISDYCAKIIAEDIASRAALSPIPGSPGIKRTNLHPQQAAGIRKSLACGVFTSILDKAVAHGAWNPQLNPGEQLQRVDAMVPTLTFAEKQAVKATARMMGMEDHLQRRGENPDVDSGIKATLHFLWVLTQDDARLVDLYRQLHAGAPSAGKIRIVSHMMDLAPVYDQTPDSKELLDFRNQQIQRTRTFTQLRTSGATYFVAYNPYRDYWQGGRPGDALKLVKDAITKHGAAGVKVYPPSGYRASGNQIEKKPTPLFTRHPANQWTARYGHIGGTTGGAALDKELEELLLWCISRDVPVFTHSGYGEFEARKGYGVANANPLYWKQFLESHPEPDGSPCRLRLCLAHAGGGDYWFGCGKHSDWGRMVYELCCQYPNVYCEVTSGEELLDANRRAYFVNQLATLFTQSEKTPHPFGKKLLYGSDWPLPDPGAPAAVLKATQEAFLHDSLRIHYADYFHLNAERYLRRKL